MQEVQAGCIRENPSLEAHCKNAPVQKTHVTLLVAHVTEPQLEKAKAIMGEILQKKILPQLHDKQFKISFEGMSSFGEKIVYAEVGEGANELRLMNEAFLEAFEAAGFDCDSRYTPHMTVMKVTILHINPSNTGIKSNISGRICRRWHSARLIHPVP